MKFQRWIDILREDVIETEYGYEPGEFTVYPDLWRPLFKEGLTPQQAFKRALDGFAEQRRIEEQAKADNWARIQAVDAEAIARQRDSAVMGKQRHDLRLRDVLPRPQEGCRYMRTSDAIRKELSEAEGNARALRRELQQTSDADHAARAEAGKNDPASGFYTGYAKDAWGYPLDPLLND